MTAATAALRGSAARRQLLRDDARGLATGASSLGALTSGYQLALGIGALLSLLGALAAGGLLRPRTAEAADRSVCNRAVSETGAASAG